MGKERSWKPKNKSHSHAWTNHYPIGVGISMDALARVVFTKSFQHLRIPCLTLYSPQDNVVNSKKIETTFDKMGCTPKKLMAVLDSGDLNQHIITGDILSPKTNKRVTQKILQFIQQIG